MDSEEYIKMEMECEPKTSFRRGRPCSRQTGIFVLLGTVCMIIFIMTSVIFSHQERKFSMLESWTNSHTSDFQSKDLEKMVSELQNLVSNLSSFLNTSGSSNPMTNEMHEKKLSSIETSMTDLGSSLKSLETKQEENLEHLMHTLSVAVSTLGSRTMGSSFHFSLLTQRSLEKMSSSQTEMKSSVEELRSFVQALSYKLSLTNLLTPGCSESGWIPFSNSCYLFSSNALNWTQAKDYCEERGALLLKFEEDSEEEWEFVTLLAKPFEFWIGLTDETTGQWRWVDDTPCTMDKVHWAPGQPDEWQGHKQGGGEDCAQITKYVNVNDNHCSVKMRFICKGPKDS